MMIPIRKFTHPAGEDQSVLVGQHQIEDDEIDLGLRHDPTHSRAIVCGRNSVALAGQIFLGQVADLAFIVNNQDVTIIDDPTCLGRPGRPRP
jgi:hypothetical protein